jgi:capsular exopolysaccharide synthesis family protein
MNYNSIMKSHTLPGKVKNEDEINPVEILQRMISKWHYFLITLLIAFFFAWLFISLSIPKYKVSTSLLIEQEQKTNSINNEQLLEGFGLGSGMKNLDNQIMILKSKSLVSRALEELNFQNEYYVRGVFDDLSLYPASPILIVPENPDSIPTGIEFSFNLLDDESFELHAELEDKSEFQVESAFGKTIKFSEGNFRIEKKVDKWPSEKTYRNVCFIHHDLDDLTESYVQRLKVEPASKNGTILSISIEGTNKAMLIDFLNKLTEIFLQNSLDKKNREAIRTIAFIDDQLIGISDSLLITENKLQEFRSRNRVMNLSSQGQAIINQAMELENEKARIEIEANYYNYLADYLLKENTGEVPIAPATMGISDPGLTKLVSDLADLQSQLYSKSLGEKNPLQGQLLLRIRNTKEALKETLNGLRRANNLARDENQNQIRSINAQATALPVTERQLLGIERKFKLNDELYTFLLEKRAVAQIQKASNMPDNEIIDSAKADPAPIKPKKSLIYLSAFFLGVFAPFFWIIASDKLSTKIKGDEDIKKITEIPVIGHIPHNQLKNNTIVMDDPSSNVSEAFRSLRSKMQFITKEASVPVILITSSCPEEGKSFTAINIASVYSLIGKRTVIVGFDLRKPRLYDDFGINNDKGVSTWLIGKDSFGDIIKATAYENLSIIPAGPIPPNPSELMALDKAAELVRLLKENYDCIIIDTSPIGTVSDTFHLSGLADTTLVTVRQNMTPIHLLENTLKDITFSDFKSVSIIVNDTETVETKYGYGGKYGYKHQKTNRLS